MDEVQVNANAAADDVAATEYGCPEDIQIIGQTLYVANTTEDRVIAIELLKKTIASFVAVAVNVPEEDAGNQITGFNSRTTSPTASTAASGSSRTTSPLTSGSRARTSITTGRQTR
jgi:hypothetical protein